MRRSKYGNVSWKVSSWAVNINISSNLSNRGNELDASNQPIYLIIVMLLETKWKEAYYNHVIFYYLTGILWHKSVPWELMKFRNQARLCLAIYHFKAHIMLMINFSRYRNTGTVFKKFNSNVAVKCESLFSNFYWFINFVKRILR